MRRVRQVQTSFSSGHLDRGMAARNDVQHYYAGGSTVRNLELLPVGGAKTRSGFRHVEPLTDIMADGGEHVRAIELRFNSDQTYLVLLTHQRLRVYHAATVVEDRAAPWRGSDLAEIDWTGSLDTLLLLHPDHAPRRLLRTGSHSSWSFEVLLLKNLPTNDFGSLDTENITLTLSSKTGSGTATVESNIFSPEMVGGRISHNYSGSKSVITGYTSPTTVSIRTEIDWSGLSVTGWSYEEPIWSDARGWPGRGTFHSDRLYLGGARQKPDTLAASRAGRYYDFNEGEGLDDEGVSWSVGTDQASPIAAIVSDRHLIVLTEGGCSASMDWPLTPGNLSSVSQTRAGSAKIRPVVVEGGILSISAAHGSGQAQGLQEHSFAEASQKYEAQDVSLLAGSLVRAPVDMTHRIATRNERANHVFVVNGDGTMAVLNTLRRQDITGWSLWDTDGRILAARVVGADLYVIVARQVGGETVYALEVLDPDLKTDAATVVTAPTPTRVHGGFGHLAGRDVRVYADGHQHRTVTVAPDGTVSLDYEAVEVEAGLPFTWEAAPMPFHIDLPDGTSASLIKRLVRATVHVLDTLDLRVNGRRQALRRLGDDLLDQPPAPFSGAVDVRLLGRDRDGVVTLSGEGPAQILSLTREVVL